MSDADDIMEVVTAIAEAESGAMLSLKELRSYFADFSDEAFKTAVLMLRDAGLVHLHHTDWAPHAAFSEGGVHWIGLTVR